MTDFTEKIENCPFCAHDLASLVSDHDVNGVQGGFCVHCHWCEGHGPNSRDSHRAIGSWNYVSRAVKKDKGVA